MIRVLITGWSGFIGSHITEWILQNTNWEIIGLDRCSSIGTTLRHNISYGGRVQVFFHDLKYDFRHNKKLLGPINYIIHCAASSHVDRSIHDPLKFIKDNVIGTHNVLMYARDCGVEKVIYFSTDEIFGSISKDMPPWKEWDRYNSCNPYAATKAAAEELCLAYHNTYKIPVIISHCMNVFGEKQNSEKFVPLVISKLIKKEKVIIHSDPTRTIPGSRNYIYAKDVANATLFLLHYGAIGDKYNIAGQQEVNNLDLAKQIAWIMGVDLNYELVDYHSSRPGHDLRYALDGSKLHSMGFNYVYQFNDALKRTIDWYLENPKWLQ